MVFYFFTCTRARLRLGEPLIFKARARRALKPRAFRNPNFQPITSIAPKLTTTEIDVDSFKIASFHELANL
jgi:hypothetical protein